MYTCINKQLVENSPSSSKTDRIKTLYVVQWRNRRNRFVFRSLSLPRRLCVQRRCESLIRKHDCDIARKKSSRVLHRISTWKLLSHGNLRFRCKVHLSEKNKSLCEVRIHRKTASCCYCCVSYIRHRYCVFIHLVFVLFTKGESEREWDTISRERKAATVHFHLLKLFFLLSVVSYTHRRPTHAITVYITLHKISQRIKRGR